jgi:uncharacterized protein
MSVEQAKDITFRSGELNINGTIVFPQLPLDETRPGVLFIHGWKSDKEGFVARAKVISELGYVCLAFDLPGHGLNIKSEGDIKQLTRQDYLEAVVSAYDYLAGSTGVDTNKISLVGSSFGAYMAAILVDKRLVYSLVLKAPSNYTDEGFNTSPQSEYNNIYPYPNEASEFNQTIAAMAVHNFKGKVLIIHLENDQTIPRSVIENYRNAVSDPNNVSSIMINGAGHQLNEIQNQEFLQILKDWFDKYQS